MVCVMSNVTKEKKVINYNSQNNFSTAAYALHTCVFDTKIVHKTLKILFTFIASLYGMVKRQLPLFSFSCDATICDDENEDVGDTKDFHLYIKLLYYYHSHNKQWNFSLFLVSHHSLLYNVLSFQLLIIKSLGFCIADASIANCMRWGRGMGLGVKERKQKFVVLRIWQKNILCVLSGVVEVEEEEKLKSEGWLFGSENIVIRCLNWSY